MCYICQTNQVKKEKMNLQELSKNGIAYTEAKGLAKCFDAYAKNSNGEEIMEVGFNPYSGYTYIALENGITICSNMGNCVEYLVTDFNDGEEYFYDEYSEALESDVFKY
jgi:hypothetical protein